MLTEQIAAGEIGVDHARVDKYLKTIFKIASRWKAILLLDEADVFLAERGLDPHANALVSVFLRQLEHYDGILFLTTNLLRKFDPAILSRVHLPLRYGPLKKTHVRRSGAATCSKPKQRQARRFTTTASSASW